MVNKKKRLIEIFGERYIDDSPEALDSYASCPGFVGGYRPDFIVRATNSSQIVDLIKYANETKTPVVTVSSSGSHRHGGTVPSAPQAIILDLSGMKNVYYIDNVFRVAAFEAGLTYGELAPILEKAGLMFDTTLAPRAEKSVVASLLETEPRINSNSQWASTDPLRATETIWGDGTLMRTGDAAIVPMGMPVDEAFKIAEDEFHSHSLGASGPEDIDYYRLLTGAQGTMGAVTWVTAKCNFIPKLSDMFLFPTNDLDKAIDFLYNVEHIRFSDGLFLLNSMNFACLMGYEGSDAVQLQEKLPGWIACAVASSRNLAPELRYKAQVTGLSDCASKAGLEMVGAVGGIPACEVMEKAYHPCAPGKYWRDGLKGASADIFFLTTLDCTQKFVEKMYEIASDIGFPASSIGVYIQPKHMGTSCRIEFTIPYDPADKAGTAKARTLFERAPKEFCDMGGYFSRPYGDWARMQLGRDAMGASTLKRLKDILDPNGIMNTGKLSAY